MTHAWCSDPSRDAAVRAAEDERTAPLPTLEECIETAFSAGVRDSFRKVGEAWAMIPKSVSASSPVDQENKGDGMATHGMRTERITLEIVHYGPESAAGWEWKYHIRPRHIFESVRVVDTHAEAVAESVAWEGARDAYRGRILRLTEERDAAIRERESWKLLADRTNERLSAAEARVAELEAASGGGKQPRGWLTKEERKMLAWVSKINKKKKLVAKCMKY
jgi:hypothetical protein